MTPRTSQTSDDRQRGQRAQTARCVRDPDRTSGGGADHSAAGSTGRDGWSSRSIDSIVSGDRQRRPTGEHTNPHRSPGKRLTQGALASARAGAATKGRWAGRCDRGQARPVGFSSGRPSDHGRSHPTRLPPLHEYCRFRICRRRRTQELEEKARPNLKGPSGGGRCKEFLSLSGPPGCGSEVTSELTAICVTVSL